MAKRSDLVTEVAEVAEAANLKSHVGPVYRNMDELARKRDQARRVEALSLRLAGLSYAQIADRMDMVEDSVRELVARTLDRSENRAAEAMRELEGARLDRAQSAIWTKVLEGDTKAIDTFLRLSQRRARLFGLDAPTSINLSINVREEMEAALRTLENVVLGEVVRVDDDLRREPEPLAIEPG